MDTAGTCISLRFFSPFYTSMIDKFKFLPFTIALVFLQGYFHLTYISLAVLVGIAILIFSFLDNDDEIFQEGNGYVFTALGGIFLLIALCICKKFGFSFEELGKSQFYPKFVRKLPSTGFMFLSIGIVILILSRFKKK